MAAELAAKLAVEPGQTSRREELVARGSLRNGGADPVEIDLAPLGSPSLALEIVDAAGAPVHLPPPPVPGGEAQRATLSSRESRAVAYPGFLPAWIPPGSYRARLRYVGLAAAANEPAQTIDVVSDWAEFVVSDD